MTLLRVFRLGLICFHDEVSQENKKRSTAIGHSGMPKLEKSITLADFSSTDLSSQPINAQDSLLEEGGHTHPTSLRSVAQATNFAFVSPSQSELS